MLTLRSFTQLSSRCAYKSTLPIASRLLLAPTKSYAKMSTSAPATNGESSFKPRFVDVSFDKARSK